MKWRDYTVKITHATAHGDATHIVTVRAIGQAHALYRAQHDPKHVNAKAIEVVR